MTNQEALQILDSVTAAARLTRQEQAKVIEALHLFRALIEPVKAPLEKSPKAKDGAKP